MSKTIIEFSDGTSAECYVAGQILYDGDTFVVFIDSTDKTVYIYQKVRLKNGKLKMKQVSNKDTFEGVCSMLNEMIDRSPDAGKKVYGQSN